MITNTKLLMPFILVMLLSLSLYAQPPGGGRGQGFDPNEMIKREKQNVYQQITDLSDDQKLLLDGIYDEFGTTINETFTEMRNNGNREGMRTKMQALRKEKDALIKDVLNESQYAQYEKIAAPRERRPQSQNSNETNPE